MYTMWNLENLFGIIFSTSSNKFNWTRYKNYTIKVYQNSSIRFITLKEFKREFNKLLCSNQLLTNNLHKDLLYTKDKRNKFNDITIIIDGTPCIITCYGFSRANKIRETAIKAIYSLKKKTNLSIKTKVKK